MSADKTTKPPLTKRLGPPTTWLNLLLGIAALVLVVSFYMVATWKHDERVYWATKQGERAWFPIDDLREAGVSEGTISLAPHRDFNPLPTPIRPAAEWSLTFLILVGIPYGLILLLGNGRLRRFLRGFWNWFWKGLEQTQDG